jgi:hypothetical protein
VQEDRRQRQSEEADGDALEGLCALIDEVPDAHDTVRLVLLGGPRLSRMLAQRGARKLWERFTTTIAEQTLIAAHVRRDKRKLVVDPVAAVLISEFRFRGPNGANDEFVELYNPGDRAGRHRRVSAQRIEQRRHNQHTSYSPCKHDAAGSPALPVRQ